MAEMNDPFVARAAKTLGELEQEARDAVGLNESTPDFMMAVTVKAKQERLALLVNVYCAQLLSDRLMLATAPIYHIGEGRIKDG